MNKRPVVIDCDPGVDDTLALCLAARQVLKNDLALLKITAPESM